MPRSPLYPILAVGLVAGAGLVLLCTPRGDEAQPATTPAPGVWATDIAGLPPNAVRGGEKATTPLEGQKRPPCEPGLETEVAKACWIAAKARPPCPKGLYESEGECLIPVMAAKRPNTSIHQ